MAIGSFPVQKILTAQIIDVGPFSLPAHGVQIFLDNQTGQLFAPTGTTLGLGHNNYEGQ